MLEVKSVDLHYGAAQALRNVSLHAQVGEVTCVLGRNGVGKTSLLDALAGQQPVSNGSIIWEGQDITRLKPYERARRGIAYVPQGREIFPLLTVEENLKTGFAPLKRNERDIPDDVFSLFPVLKDMLHRRGGDLSGGPCLVVSVTALGALTGAPVLRSGARPGDAIVLGGTMGRARRCGLRCMSMQTLWAMRYSQPLNGNPSRAVTNSSVGSAVRTARPARDLGEGGQPDVGETEVRRQHRTGDVHTVESDLDAGSGASGPHPNLSDQFGHQRGECSRPALQLSGVQSGAQCAPLVRIADGRGEQ